MFTFEEYSQLASSTAIYPATVVDNVVVGCYPFLGLSGEVGEVSEKIKKLIRDKGGIVDEDFLKSLEKELGDVLWYLNAIAKDFGLNLSYIASKNIEKLQDRKSRGTIQGSGDNR